MAIHCCQRLKLLLQGAGDALELAALLSAVKQSMELPISDDSAALWAWLEDSCAVSVFTSCMTAIACQCRAARHDQPVHQAQETVSLLMPLLASISTREVNKHWAQ